MVARRPSGDERGINMSSHYKSIAIAILFFIVLVLANAVGNLIDRLADADSLLNDQEQTLLSMKSELDEKSNTDRLIKDLLRGESEK